MPISESDDGSIAAVGTQAAADAVIQAFDAD
jgi:hypothetical protein